MRLAAAVLHQARRTCEPIARQLLTHLMKPLAFQILAKVRCRAVLRSLTPGRMNYSQSPTATQQVSEPHPANHARHTAELEVRPGSLSSAHQ